jgi:hypothetical protein
MTSFFEILQSLLVIMKNTLTFATENKKNSRNEQQKYSYATPLPKDWLVSITPFRTCGGHQSSVRSQH